ncbi:sulfite exporter TauE/SafE family protein [Pseudodesulfovibrio karagichevae]|uniref:Probable membrane transporter protein n=1 Tax=Pseudodesulfovibrio karagichevae TaxID=3239305 RepID=A0ABV4JY42_9BACT
MHDSLYFFLAWFLGGLVNNLTGFGAALVAIPLMANSVPLETAIPASTLIVLTVNLQMGWKYRHYMHWQRMVYLLVGGVAGTVIGILLHTVAGNGALKLSMGVFIAAYAVYSLMMKPHAPRDLGPGWGVGAGFASTALGAIFGFNGPPLALYVSKAGWAQEEAKGLLGACFIMTGAMIFAGQLMSGMHNAQTLAGYLLGCPGALLGGTLGLFLSRFLSQKAYQKGVLILVFGSGMYIVLSSL